MIPVIGGFLSRRLVKLVLVGVVAVAVGGFVWHYKSVVNERNELRFSLEAVEAAREQEKKKYQADISTLEELLARSQRSATEAHELREVIEDAEDGPLAPVLRSLFDELSEQPGDRERRDTRGTPELSGRTSTIEH